MSRIQALYEALPRAPASGPAHPDLDRLLAGNLPERAAPLGELLDLVFGQLNQGGVNTISPGNLSYVNGGGLFHSALAALVTAALNRYVTYWGAAPGLAQLESTVIRWFCDMVGLPAGAGGVLLTGGSTANLSAIVTARKALLGENFSRGIVYASDQMHHSVEKAALIAGFPRRNVRTIASDATFAIRTDRLEAAIAADMAAGLQPFLVVASAGTTNTGAVDDLGALAAVCAQQRLWLHVDAAYGGFFLLTERGKAALRGIELADSIALDPHKSMFLPYGTGCLLVRELAALKRAHEVHSEYISEIVSEADDVGAVNFADLSIEMSRELRGLRVWLPLKMLGAETFRAALDEKLDLARLAADAIAATPGLALLAQPQLSILAFAAGAEGLSPTEADGLNQRILDRVNALGRVHLSSTTLGGRLAIRICVLSFRARREQVEMCLADIRAASSAEIAALAKPS